MDVVTQKEKCSKCGSSILTKDRRIRCYVVNFTQDGGIGGYISASDKTIEDTYQMYGTTIVRTFAEAKKVLMGVLLGEKREVDHQLRQLRKLKKGNVSLSVLTL